MLTTSTTTTVVAATSTASTASVTALTLLDRSFLGCHHLSSFLFFHREVSTASLLSTTMYLVQSLIDLSFRPTPTSTYSCRSVVEICSMISSYKNLFLFHPETFFSSFFYRSDVDDDDDDCS